MAVLKKRKKLRVAPRLKIDAELNKTIRFTTSKQKKIFSSTIYDISESGISFLCSRRLAPQIDEIIMMEFAPIGSMQLACMGRVARIETPNTYASWENFPERIKIGLEFYELPKQYKRVISDSLKKAFSQKKIKPNDIFIVHQASGLGWFSENWQSLLATIALIIGTVAAAFMIWDGASQRQPASPEWSKGFFQKIKPRE